MPSRSAWYHCTVLIMKRCITTPSARGGGQTPVLQNMMGNYLEQSRAMFEKLQEQMTTAGVIFPGFPPAKR